MNTVILIYFNNIKLINVIFIINNSKSPIFILYLKNLNHYNK